MNVTKTFRGAKQFANELVTFSLGFAVATGSASSSRFLQTGGIRRCYSAYPDAEGTTPCLHTGTEMPQTVVAPQHIGGIVILPHVNLGLSQRRTMPETPLVPR